MARKAKQQQKAEEPWVRAGHAQVVAWLRQVGRITVTNSYGTPVTIYAGRAKCGPNRGQYYVAFNGDQRIYSKHWGTERLIDYQALAAQAVLDKVKPKPSEADEWLQARYGQPAPAKQVKVSTHEKRLIIAVQAINTALKALNG